MNSIRSLERSIHLVLEAAARRQPQRRLVHSTATYQLPMKPGTPIPGLDFMKDKDPPVALERSEYPEWVNSLAEKEVTLAQLRKIPVEEASDREMMRYLKLTRRIKIKEQNEASKA